MPKKELLFIFVPYRANTNGLYTEQLNSGNFARTKATRANSNGLGCAINHSSYLTDVGLPSSVCFTMRVRNCLSEDNALSANTALCHIDTS